ncbi:MAG: LptF/LptG family permease [Nitrospirae bacterium]|nr:LptF/LptG family permease [Nitrospirota bacterium]
MLNMMILDRYFLKEFLPPFLLTLSLLTGMLFVQQLMEFIELSLTKGVDSVTLFKIFLFAIPSLLVLTLPISVLISSIIVMNRFSSDNELISIRSAGLSFYRIVRPIFYISAGVGLLTLLLATWAKPWGGNSLKEISFEVLKKRINVALEEGIFNDLFDKMMIYVEEMPNYSDLKGIFISDLRNPEEPALILAQEGTFVTDETSSSVGFQLINGNIYRKGENENLFQQIVFSRYDLKIDLSGYIQKPGERVKENLGLYALRKKISSTAVNKQNIEDLQRLQEYYKTYALPLTTILFGLLGPSLGTFSRRAAGNLGGFAIGIGVVILYYFMTVFGDYCLVQNWFSPFLSAFLPNAILFLFSLFFLIKTDRQILWPPKKLMSP